MPRKKRLLKSDRRSRKTRSVRFLPEEEAHIQRRADRITRGDFSKYVRYAAIHFEPKPEDLETAK